MPWHGPQNPDDFPTLGWIVLDEMAEKLPSPMDSGQPFILTDEQATYVLQWYELDPETGEFVNRRGRLEMAKGWGKSPLLAAIAIEELAGLVCFDGWDSHGEPKAARWGEGGRPPAWVQIAAVSEDQTDNTYAALFEMLTADENRAAKAYGIDQGRTRLYLKGRPGRLEPVTASAGSREGQRVTFAVLDETHLWTQRNGGRKLAGTLRRNAAKMSGRTFETTNAPVLGERSVAEESGTDSEPGVLHIARRPSVEPSLDWPEPQLRTALSEVYGDSYWAPIDRILAEISDPATSWDDALRFYFNVRTAGVGRAVDPRLWDSRKVAKDIPAGARVGVGFDGSISQDATVIRICDAEGHSRIVRAWERPQGIDLDRWLADHPSAGDWTVTRSEVHQSVAEVFATYSVGLMLCDTPKWYSEIEGWQERYGEEIVLPFDTNQARKFAPAVDRWLTGIREGSHTHDGDPLTDRHVRSAHLKKVRLAEDEADGRTKYVLVKGEDRSRIDAAVTDVLAYEAAMTMPAAEPAKAPMFYSL